MDKLKSLRISAETWKQLKAEAAHNDVTIGEMVGILLKEYKKEQ